MSIRVYYTKEGAEPFRFVYSGCQYVIQPPDKFWKETKERYLAGTRYNKINGSPIPGGEVYRKKTVWVEDDDKNMTGDKPKNYLDVTPKMWNYIQKKHRNDLSHLTTERNLEVRYEDALKMRREEYDKELEAQRKQHELEMAKIREEHERRVAEFNAQFEKVEANVKETKTRRAKA